MDDPHPFLSRTVQDGRRQRLGQALDVLKLEAVRVGGVHPGLGRVPRHDPEGPRVERIRLQARRHDRWDAQSDARNSSRVALNSSAWLVGMPWGPPLTTWRRADGIICAVRRPDASKGTLLS